MLKTATYLPANLLALAFASVIAAVATPATSEPVKAQAQGPDLSMKIEYRDLDLTTEAGRMKLQHRVRVAAHDLCGRSGQDFLPSLALECESNAIASAAKMQSRVLAHAYGAAPADQVAVAAVTREP